MNTTVSLPSTTVDRELFAALEGQPLHRTYALLQPTDCPTCGAGVRSMGFADWVKQHGIVVTLWACTSSSCRQDGSTFRLETRVIDTPPVVEATAPKLTSAQQRYLAEIRAAGPKGRRYNGRATAVLEALEHAGLVHVDWDMDILAGGLTRWILTAVAS